MTKLYFNACLDLGLEVKEIKETQGFQVKIGNSWYYFWGSSTPFNNTQSAYVAKHKYISNQLLAREGIPVTNSVILSKEKYDNNNFDFTQLNFPVAIKPVFGECGYDVTCNIKNMHDLEVMLRDVFTRHAYICIEEFQNNLRAYRISVFYDQIIALSESVPAYVMGDGESTIDDLIKLENERRRNFSHLNLIPIQKTFETKVMFEELGITSQTIPLLNQKVPLLYKCNTTTGGTVLGLNIKDICSENAKLLIKAARVLNLNLVGFDFLCENIAIPFHQSRAFVIEANHNPDFSYDENTPTGVRTKVSKLIIKKLVRKSYATELMIFLDKSKVKIMLIILIILCLAMGFGIYR